MGISNIPFLNASNPNIQTGYAKPLNSEGYHQAYKPGVPNTTPAVYGVGIPSVEDMELATKVAEANIGAKNPIDKVASSQGVGFVPYGDGEVHPFYEEDEHVCNYFC